MRVTSGDRAAPVILVRATVAFFVVVKEGLVHDAIAAGRRILTGEIPVASVRWNGGVQVFDLLEDHFDLPLPLDVFRTNDLGDTGRKFFIGEGSVDFAHVIHEATTRHFFAAKLVNLLENSELAALFEKR